MEKKISIIIPNKNNIYYLKRCLTSLEKQAYTNYEVIIIDNGSDGEDVFEYYRELFQKEKYKIILHRMNFNYSKMNNLGVKNATGAVLLLLNNDTEFQNPYTLNYMLKQATKVNVGAVGITLLYENNRIQHIGVNFDRLVPKHIFKLNKKELSNDMGDIIYCHAVTGACLMIEKSKYLLVGGMDEDLEVVYNDIALSLKLKKQGFVNVCVNKIYMYHHESISRKNTRYLENEKYFFAQWGNYIEKLPIVGEFQTIINKYLTIDNNQVYIFGASVGGRNTLGKLSNLGIEVKAFVDNDSNKWGKLYEGKPIISFKELLEIYKKEKIRVIVSSTYANEIYQQIEVSGIEHNDIFYFS